MWTCPNCGRKFQKTNQGHYCGTAPATVDEYISRQEESLRPILMVLRTTIQDAIPDAQERISWGMPTWWEGRNLIQFAANKRHIGLYPGEEAIVFFKDRLSGYVTSKGTVRLPLDKPLPLDLISDMAKWCCQQKP